MNIKKNFLLFACIGVLLPIFGMRMYAENLGKEQCSSPTGAEETVDTLLLKLRRLSASLLQLDNELSSVLTSEHERTLQQITSEFEHTSQQMRLIHTQLLILSCKAHTLDTGAFTGCVDQFYFSLMQQQIPLSLYDTPAVELTVAVELYKDENGQYPRSLQQLRPHYLHLFSESSSDHYIESSGDTEASWMNIRYYPPKNGQDTYTLLHDFPVQGRPNIGRLRKFAEQVLPFIRGLETYHHEHHEYPKNLRSLPPVYIQDTPPGWRYTAYKNNRTSYRLYYKVWYDTTLNFSREGDKGTWWYGITDVAHPFAHSMEIHFENLTTLGAVTK